MNPGTMAAIHLAAASTKARTKLIDAFRLAGATAAERARPIAALGLEVDDRSFAELVRKGVLRGVDRRGRPVTVGDEYNPAESYWLDEAALIADRDGTSGRGSKQAAMLVLAIFLLIAGVALVLRTTRG